LSIIIALFLIFKRGNTQPFSLRKKRKKRKNYPINIGKVIFFTFALDKSLLINKLPMNLKKGEKILLKRTKWCYNNLKVRGVKFNISYKI